MIVLREAIEEELLKQMLVEWEIFETLEVEGSQKKAKFRSQFEKLCYLCRRNCLMAMGIHSSNQTPTKLKKNLNKSFNVIRKKDMRKGLNFLETFVSTKLQILYF